MATATASEKKAKGGKAKAGSAGELPSVEIKKVTTENIALESLVSNTAQSRGLGAVATLQAMGIGLFEKIQADKEPLWDLLMSDKPEERKKGRTLLEEFEPEVVEIAKSMRSGIGQLQPVGVWETSKNDFDVIYGMQRCMAAAYNYSEDDKFPETIEAKVFTFVTEPDPLALKVMGLAENTKSKREGPIDKALTYKEFLDKGYTADEVAKHIGKSKQHVEDYGKRLLDPKIKDLREKVQSGEVAVEKALKVLVKRKRQGQEEGDDEGGGNGESRVKFFSSKELKDYYNAARKPKNVTDREWELLTTDDVRRLVALRLGFRFAPWKPSPEPEEKTGKGKKGKAATGTTNAESNGSEAEKGPVIKVRRGQASQLLMALGKTDARTWEQSKIKDKLENIFTISDEKTNISEESEALQKLLEKLQKGFKDGASVELVAD